jgi:hypothetical protein
MPDKETKPKILHFRVSEEEHGLIRKARPKDIVMSDFLRAIVIRRVRELRKLKEE